MMSQPPRRFEFHQVRDFGEILSITFEFLRDHFNPIIRGWLCMAAPFALVGAIGSVMISNINENNAAAILTSPGDFLGAMAAAVFGSLLGYQFTALVGYQYILLYREHEREIGLDMLWVGVKQNFWFLLWTSVATMLVLLAAFVLLVIPGIYLFPVIAVATITRLVERQGIFAAISRTRRLISGFWWQTSGLILIILVIVGVMGVVFQAPQTILSVLIGLNSLNAGDPVNVFEDHPLLAILSLIGNTLGYSTQIVMAIAFTFQYFSLVERKDATSLMRRVEQMGDSGPV